MLKRLGAVEFTPAVLALIVMNLIPLIGVFFFGWDAGTIVFLYWLENVVIGLLNILKILSCREDSSPPSIGGVIYLCFFFSLHYGLFCGGHYMFLKSTYPDLPALGDMFSTLTGPVLFWSLLGLTFSHIVSLFVNFYGKGEYKTRSPNAQMFMPYSRIVLLHVVIVLSGFASMAAGQGIATLILLVGFKIIFDLAAHIVEHSKKDNFINPGVG